MSAYLLLEDGTRFDGDAAGAEALTREHIDQTLRDLRAQFLALPAGATRNIAET